MRKGYHTKCKDLILKYAETHAERRFSAADVFSYLKEQGSQVNLTTVYRNLEKMIENKLLIKFKTAEQESALYQFVKPHGNCHEHLHMQCSVCGKVMHLECCLMNEIMEHLKMYHGFMLECTGSVLNGICADCKNMEEMR